MSASGANHSRLTSLIYPDTWTIGYNYASGLDNTISRLTSMTASSTTLEGLAYLGLGTVVERTHPEPDLTLTYIGTGPGEGGDQYVGLDRFGRIIDQRWGLSSTDVDRYKNGYDRNSNRLYRTNELDHSFDELYHADGAANGYDGLNQLSEFQRGTLSDTNSDSIPDTVASAARYQTWDPDAVGNFEGVNTNGTNQSRTQNKQNQSTVVGGNNLTFDRNGNMTTDETGRTITFDAWNKRIKITNTTRYAIDALGRRIAEGTTALFYSTNWQVVEERVSGTTKVRMVWSPVYVDAMVLRDRDADNSGGNGLEERLYVMHDANFNVTSVVTTGTVIAERFVYDPYGRFDFKDSSYGVRSSSSYAWVYLHQGGRFDATAALFHFRNREYSPTLMRWAGVDPIGFEAWDVNQYRTLLNRPGALVDPFGQMPPGGLQPVSPVRGHDPITADVGSAGGVAITGPQDALIRELQQKLCCCPPDKRQMAEDLLRTLIELSNFHWPHSTGFNGNCGGWMDRYWDQLDSGMFRGVTLRSALAGVKECITVERVTWDNPLGTALCIAGLGIVGAVLIATGAGIWGGATYIGGAYVGGGFAVGGAAGSIWGGIYGNNAAHNAIKIKLCDGTVFYLDDGNYGGATHVFYGLPPWFRNEREPPWIDK